MSAMKNKILILLALLTLTVPAMAEDDDCTLSLDALTPVMKTEAKNHSFKLDQEAQQLTETAELQDGTKITYEAGGCAHYSFTFRFDNIPGGVPAEPEDPFALALILMESIPAKDKDNIELMQRVMTEQQASGFAAFENNVAEFSCGDAFCSLELAPDHVTVGYDFAL